MQVAFLCGSGISIPACMPSTEAITEAVLSGEGVNRHTDTNYYFMKRQPTHGDETHRVCEFLKLLKEESDLYYRPWPNNEAEFIKLFGEHSTNYEDLCYLVAQLEDSQTREFENPAVERFRMYLEKEVKEKALPRGVGREWCFDTLLAEARAYAECVVRKKLCANPQGNVLKKTLSLFGDAQQDDDVSHMDVYTLNHDTLMEQFLCENDICFTDGFDPEANGVRYWNPDLFEKAGPKTRLFKLHGSVDWFQFPSPETNEKWRTRSVGIPLNGDHAHCKDKNGKPQHASPPRPLMLLGTFNKMLLYQQGIFADLQFRFYDNLRKADQLVICGYGFGDKAVNARLLDWAWENRDHKLVVIDPDRDSLMRRARGAFRRSWESLQEAGQLAFIDKGIQCVSWTEVRKAMGVEGGPA